MSGSFSLSNSDSKQLQLQPAQPVQPVQEAQDFKQVIKIFSQVLIQSNFDLFHQKELLEAKGFCSSCYRAFQNCFCISCCTGCGHELQLCLCPSNNDHDPVDGLFESPNYEQDHDDDEDNDEHGELNHEEP